MHRQKHQSHTGEKSFDHQHFSADPSQHQLICTFVSWFQFLLQRKARQPAHPPDTTLHQRLHRSHRWHQGRLKAAHRQVSWRCLAWRFSKSPFDAETIPTPAKLRRASSCTEIGQQGF